MEQFKRAQVVILPNISKTNRIGSLNLTQSNNLHNWNTNGTTYNPNSQHLYITSDDEIKEGDYYLNPLNKRILKADTDELVNNVNHISYAKKVIATTDKSLTIDILTKRVLTIGLETINLPEPSSQFITKYIEEYNKGDIIENVLVEYIDNGEEGWIGDDIYGEPFWNEKLELKINPKDNTISIKPFEQTWDNIAEEFNQWCMTMGKVPVTNQYQAYLINNYQPPKKK